MYQFIYNLVSKFLPVLKNVYIYIYMYTHTHTCDSRLRKNGSRFLVVVVGLKP
jgi:hypothetical protein